MSCVCDDDGLIRENYCLPCRCLCSRCIRDQVAVLYISFPILNLRLILKAIQGQTSNSGSSSHTGVLRSSEIASKYPKEVKTGNPSSSQSSITVNRLLWLLSTKCVYVATE